MTTNSDNSNTTELSTFAVFPLLPTEIRLRIFAFTFHPRTVSVHIFRARDYNKALHHREFEPDYPQSPPSVLQLVNHEARRAFLEHFEANYSRYFEGKSNCGVTVGCHFDPDIDTLCIPSGLRGLRWMLHLYPEQMRMVKFLNIAPDGLDNHKFHNSSPTFDWGHCKLHQNEVASLEVVTVLQVYHERYSGDPHQYLFDTLLTLQHGLSNDSKCPECHNDRPDLPNVSNGFPSAYGTTYSRTSQPGIWLQKSVWRKSGLTGFDGSRNTFIGFYDCPLEN